MGARLLYINEHSEIDYVSLPATTPVFGRPGAPFKLAVGERPPKGRCRISRKEDGWYIENKGEPDLTLVNGEPVKLQRLKDWDEIRCGVLTMRFEEAHWPAPPPKVQRELEELRARGAASDNARQTEERQLDEARADVVRLDAECARLRSEVNQQQRRQEELRTRAEALKWELDDQRTDWSAQVESLSQALSRALKEADYLVRSRDAALAQLQTMEARAKEAEAIHQRSMQTVKEHEQQEASISADLAVALRTNQELLDGQHLLLERAQAAEQKAEAERVAHLGAQSALETARKQLQQAQVDRVEVNSLRLEAARARRDCEDCRSQLRRRTTQQHLPIMTPSTSPADCHQAQEWAQELSRMLTDLEFEVYRIEGYLAPRTGTATDGAAGGNLVLDLAQVSAVLRAARDRLDQLQMVLRKD
ncbi:MAG: hypothetical protein JNM83_08790 [Myxococcales bacterium]|nr:hypothetical protein [Myxococcales bacterium]